MFLANSNPICSLARVEILRNGENTNVKLELTGHASAMAEAQGILSKQSDEDKQRVGAIFVERDAKRNSLIISGGVNPKDEKSTDTRVADLVEYVFQKTGCRLGGVELKADAACINSMPMQHGPKLYSPVVAINRAIDRADKGNLVGKYAIEVIRRDHARVNLSDSGSAPKDGLCIDPRPYADALRLLDVTHTDADERKMQMMAEQYVTRLEREYHLYHKKSSGIFLAGLHTEPLHNESRKALMPFAHLMRGGHKKFVTTALLTGEPEALESAEKILMASLPPSVLKLRQNDDGLEVLFCGDDKGDPAKLVDLLSSRVRATLPMDLHAISTSASHPSSHFNPALETEVWDDVPAKERGKTGNVLASYVGLQFPGSEIIMPERTTNDQSHGFARVVVQDPKPAKEDALSTAEAMKGVVESRIKRGEGAMVGG